MLSGALAYIQALNYLPKKWMLKNILLSGTLSLILFAGLVALIYYQGDDLSELILSWFSIKEQDGILNIGIDWLSRILLWVLALFSFKYLILIVAGPFVGDVSEKVKQASELGRKLSYMKTGLVSSSYRGIQLALKNAFKEILITIVLLVIGLVTGLIAITGPLIIVLQAYYLGFANLDIVFEKHLSARDARTLIKKNKGMAIMNGLGFLAILLIPFLGIFIAPAYSMAAATKSGTRLLV